MWRIIKQTSIVLSLLIVGVSVAGFGYVRASGAKTLSVQSGSMVPTFHKGDLVVVKSVPEYRVGDVITFINPANKKETVTHRIIAVRASSMSMSYVTKGDANMAPDIPVASSAVIGKLQHIVPRVGYVVDFMRKPLGLALIIYVPALMIMISELKRLAAYYKSRQPFVDASRKAQLIGHNTSHTAIKSLPLVLLVPLLLAVKAQAAINSKVLFSSNTVKTASLIPPSGGTCTNNHTNVNVNSHSNQTSTTGNTLNNNNQTGGSAQSDNVSNTNSTNINVSVSSC
jgi:signal peptidase